jgi:hypothetical protein
LTGTYDVVLKIFAGGARVAQTRSTFNVEKIGVAQFVATTSVNHSLIYGLAIVGVALLMGWIALIAFRRGCSQEENSSNGTFACMNKYSLTQWTRFILRSWSREYRKPCLKVGATSATLGAVKCTYSKYCK